MSTSSTAFRRTSLLLSGSAGEIGQKIDSIIKLAKQHKLSVIVDGPQQLGSFELKNADIVVMKDVKSTEDLNFNLSYYSHHARSSDSGHRQFIVGTSLTLGELVPLAQLLQNHKFEITAVSPATIGSRDASSPDSDDAYIRSWVAERFLIPATVTSSTFGKNAFSIASEYESSPSLTSLILMGKNEDSISKEINELVGNVADLGLNIPISFVDAAKPSPSLSVALGQAEQDNNVENIGIVVCTNVGKLKDLHRLIRDYSGCRQFLIATTLSESEVRPLDGGGLHKFDYFNCSTSSFSAFQDDVVPEMIKEWKKYAAAAVTKNSSIPSTSLSTASTESILPVESKDEAVASTKPAVSVESKDEVVPVPVRRFNNEHSLIISGPEGCGKSSKLKHLTMLAKESRLEVKTVAATVFEFGKLLSPEVIVCSNVDTIEHLQYAIKCAKRTQTQLLLGTILTEKQLLPFKDELLNLGIEVYFFETISAEERAKSAAVVMAGGLAPTICLDWAIEWAGCDTSSCCVERLQAARKS